jgi:hypothetical protein
MLPNPPNSTKYKSNALFDPILFCHGRPVQNICKVIKRRFFVKNLGGIAIKQATNRLISVFQRFW